MGLDMYAYAVPRSEENTNFYFPAHNTNEKLPELAYWRKFNALHGWMEDLWRQKCDIQNLPSDMDFNLIPLRLTLQDLSKLEDDINNNRLKPRSGFFFGPLEIYPEDIEDTREFIKNAREEIHEGKDVYYNSWW